MKLYYNIIGFLLSLLIVVGVVMPAAISVNDSLVVVGSFTILLLVIVPVWFKWLMYIISLTEKGDMDA